ncbi:MAG: lytic transglycosylase domain-containing protein [Treponema sp.]|jgi:soluble lytic murein transglycosylase|nr:lytic transglycosylase domain-containing protein [Treponema sp.]
MVVSLASCEAQPVLDLSRGEAARRLKAGDIGFILDKPPERMGELARIHVSAPYYAGLLAQDRGGEGGEERAAALFEAALDGAGRFRQEAAGELLRFARAWDGPAAQRFLTRLEGRPAQADPALRTLRAACLYKAGRFADLQTLYGDSPLDLGPWDRAFLVVSRAASGVERGKGLQEELADFFLAPASSGEAAPEEARLWALEELGERLLEFAGPAAAAAAAGRSSMGRLAYGQGLSHFRKVLAVEEGLFFRRLPLLGDLGRAFVFTDAQAEGLALFLDWNRRVQEGGLDGAGLDNQGIRYHILYYIARILRALRRYAEASYYFAQALDFAPDPIQADACIWYILSISLQEQPQETASLISHYGARWSRDSYFADILDRLARYLVAARRWDSLAEVFSLIQNRSDGNNIAKYAYILGAALAEGLFTPDPGAASQKTAEEYLRIAMGQGDASFYYRGLAASRLGEKTLPVPTREAGDRNAGEKRSPGDDLEFLLGFFQYGAAGLAFEFIAAAADRLSPNALRTLAAAFAEAGRWEDSIRTVSCYATRDGYTMMMRDLELYYPRAFTEMVEAAASEEALSREMLFALIRTESAFSPGIRSRVGAMGLTQLMSATAADMAERIRRRGGPDYAAAGELDLEDPETNICLGAAYLRYLMDRTESPLMALLAYNGGIGRLRRWRNAESALGGDLFLETVEYNETREYGRKVLAAAAAYGYLYYGMAMEAVFADMYN